MITKDWLKVIAKLKPDECRELSVLLADLADRGPRDAARETRLQELINSMPDAPDLGMAELLHQGRMAAQGRIAAGLCPQCGLPKPPSEEQPA